MSAIHVQCLRYKNTYSTTPLFVSCRRFHMSRTARPNFIKLWICDIICILHFHITCCYVLFYLYFCLPVNMQDRQDADGDGRLRSRCRAATWRTWRNIYASSLILAYSIHYMKTWRHPRNRKYLTYCTAVRGGPSHGHMQQVQQIWWTWVYGVEICERTDRRTNKQTNIHTYRHAYRNTSQYSYGKKRYSLPILVTERWARSWSRCT